MKPEDAQSEFNRLIAEMMKESRDGETLPPAEGKKKSSSEGAALAEMNLALGLKTGIAGSSVRTGKENKNESETIGEYIKREFGESCQDVLKCRKEDGSFSVVLTTQDFCVKFSSCFIPEKTLMNAMTLDTLKLMTRFLFSNGSNDQKLSHLYRKYEFRKCLNDSMLYAEVIE